MNEVDVDTYERSITCEYRGESYVVRDNGAVFRRARSCKRRRPLDDAWTFGRPSPSDGYMRIAGDTVHRIVATAFYGPQPSSSHIVDHIDTNRRNNRPENLRWITRLENVLLNPITAKRIILLCGSIEKFLENPRDLPDSNFARGLEWMRTVTKAEADHCLASLTAWAQSAGHSSGGNLGEWIFGRDTQQTLPPVREEPVEQLVESTTPGAMQRKWQTPTEFPACPESGIQRTFRTYFDRLRPERVFAYNRYGTTTVVEAAMAEDGSAVYVLSECENGAVNPWSLAKVTFEDGNFVHESRGTFFEFQGAKKEFTLVQGLPWEGGDSIDDYC